VTPLLLWLQPGILGRKEDPDLFLLDIVKEDSVAFKATGRREEFIVDGTGALKELYALVREMTLSDPALAVIKDVTLKKPS
ncbi:MAG: hypothetical protein ACREUP_03095, partial [Burkholderiales bacterium]